MIDNFDSHDPDPITRRDWVLLWAAVALACGLFCTEAKAQDRTVRIDGFDNRQRAQVLRAVNERNAAGEHYQIVEGVPAKVIIGALPGDGKGRLATTFNAGPVSIVSVYVDALGVRDLCGIVEHELGHVEGRQHDDHGVMAARYSAETRCGK